MFSIFARFGLLICAAVILFLARRLHTKAGGKSEKTQKTIATILGIIAGLALMGTVVGGWMGDVAGASPYIAAAMFLFAAGGLVIDWWADGKPDKLAFWCAVALPLAAVIGYSQVSNVGDEIGKNAEQVSSTLDNGGKPAGDKPKGK